MVNDALKQIWEKVDKMAGPHRLETEAEHIARDMREGRFPERSDRIQVPVDPHPMTHDTPPKRIWVIPDTSGVGHEWHSGWYQGRQNARYSVEYTLTSEAEAMVAAALREAEQNYLHLHTAAYEVWKWFETARPDLIGPRAEKLRDAVMGPRPYGVADQPASAALDKLIAEAEARGMEKAAGICEGIRTGIANGPMPEGARFDYEQAIRAAKGATT